MMTGFFTFAATLARVYLVKEQKILPTIASEEIHGENKMSTVAVTLNVPQAEKDLIDAAMIAVNDLKNKKAGSLVSDELPAIIKMVGELSELMAELKTRQSLASLAYLAQQLLGI
jgi:hypothetical protein